MTRIMLEGLADLSPLKLCRSPMRCRWLMESIRSLRLARPMPVPQSQLEAIFGWQGGAMASPYTRAADRRRLTFEAMHKLNANDERSSMVAPLYPGANTRAKTEMKSNAKFF